MDTILTEDVRVLVNEMEKDKTAHKAEKGKEPLKYTGILEETERNTDNDEEVPNDE